MTGTKTSPVIVALDVPTRDEAAVLVNQLRGLAGMFKIGSRLFTAEGPDVVRAVIDSGERVFLDLKFHDIPNTVATAAVEAGKLGVSMLTVHASGGAAVFEATRRAIEDSLGESRPLVVAVTVLTSMDETALASIGVSDSPGQQVLQLARIARSAGADGFVCSAEEIRMIRDEFGPTPGIVTPGVRMPGGSVDDQKRVRTPNEAIAAGADWIVMGRPIYRATDPRAALKAVVDSLGGHQLMTGHKEKI